MIITTMPAVYLFYLPFPFIVHCVKRELYVATTFIPYRHLYENKK